MLSDKFKKYNTKLEQSHASTYERVDEPAKLTVKMTTEDRSSLERV